MGKQQQNQTQTVTVVNNNTINIGGAATGSSGSSASSSTKRMGPLGWGAAGLGGASFLLATATSWSIITSGAVVGVIGTVCVGINAAHKHTAAKPARHQEIQQQHRPELAARQRPQRQLAAASTSSALAVSENRTAAPTSGANVPGRVVRRGEVVDYIDPATGRTRRLTTTDEFLGEEVA